ncbi:hypothetical protein BGZ60DRAFT_348340, partial [Tricladium varicosporioides]
SIRLLTLHPSSSKYPDILTCSLQEVPLSSKPDYQALSYTWGSNAFTHTLHLSPSGEKEGVKLWVDAVCIDQFSPSEKAHQIPLMAQIYAQAEIVLIWFG